MSAQEAYAPLHGNIPGNIQMTQNSDLGDKSGCENETFMVATDIQGRSHNLHHFYPGTGSNWGSSGFP